MTLTLRPYQNRMISETRDHMVAGTRAILCQAATGAGKTALAAFMLGTAQARGNHCGFLVHRRELVFQSAAMFEKIEIPYSVMLPGYVPPRGARFYRHSARIQIASVQTLARRLERTKPYDLIMWDEAHHCSAGTWKKIRAAYPEAYHVGLTATPWRLDGAGLAPYFDVMVQGPPISDLMRDGFLSKYDLYRPPGIDTKGIKTEMGDFVRGALAAAVDKPSITGDIVAHYWKHAKGKRMLGFAPSVEVSKHIVDRFRAHGISAAHVDADTDEELRAQIFADLASGETLCVWNVDLASEGFDCPAVEAVSDASPTQSLTKYLQRVGRALRVAPGKDRAIILDHAGNSRLHGLPDDTREWPLDSRGACNRSKAESSVSTRTCPVCFCVQRSGVPVCPYCRHEFKVNSRTVEFKDGELERVGGHTVYDGPPIVKFNPKLGEGSTYEDEQELVRRFTAMGYPKPRAIARQVIAKRKLHATLALPADLA